MWILLECIQYFIWLAFIKLFIFIRGEIWWKLTGIERQLIRNRDENQHKGTAQILTIWARNRFEKVYVVYLSLFVCLRHLALMYER